MDQPMLIKFFHFVIWFKFQITKISKLFLLVFLNLNYALSGCYESELIAENFKIILSSLGFLTKT